VGGRLLRIATPDGHWHRWAMPMELLAGDGTELRRVLLDLGLHFRIGTKWARMALIQLLTACQPAGRALCVPHVGWHDRSFVMLDEVFGDTGELVVFQPATPPHHRRGGGPGVQPLCAQLACASWLDRVQRYHHRTRRHAGADTCTQRALLRRSASAMLRAVTDAGASDRREAQCRRTPSRSSRPRARSHQHRRCRPSAEMHGAFSSPYARHVNTRRPLWCDPHHGRLAMPKSKGG
jgi:hypothetical protein